MASQHSRRRRRHRRRPRRLRRRDPRRPARPRHRLRRDGQDARRHLRQRRLHPVQGAAATRPSTSSSLRQHAAEHGIGVDDLRIDLAQMLKRKDDVVAQNTKGVEFLFRKNKITWAKGRGTLRAGNVVDVAGADGATTTYAGEARHHRDRLGADRAAVPQVRRAARALERRRAHDPGGPEAPHRDRRRRHRPRARLRLAPARREGHRRRARADDPPRHGRGRREGSGAASSASRGSSCARARRSPARGARANTLFVDVEKDGATETLEADYVLVSVGRRPSLSGIDAAALGLALGTRGEIARRRPDAHEPAERVRHRRLRRRQAARAQGGGGGRHRGRGDRGQAGAHALPLDARRRVHVAGDRDGRARRARGEGRAAAQYRVGKFPFSRERARAHDGRDRGLREVHRRREDRRAARRAHDRPERLRADRRGRARVRVSRLAPRTSASRCTRTRRCPRPRRKRRSRRWAARSTSSDGGHASSCGP